MELFLQIKEFITIWDKYVNVFVNLQNEEYVSIINKLKEEKILEFEEKRKLVDIIINISDAIYERNPEKPINQKEINKIYEEHSELKCCCNLRDYLEKEIIEYYILQEEIKRTENAIADLQYKQKYLEALKRDLRNLGFFKYF